MPSNSTIVDAEVAELVVLCENVGIAEQPRPSAVLAEREDYDNGDSLTSAITAMSSLALGGVSQTAESEVNIQDDGPNNDRAQVSGNAFGGLATQSVGEMLRAWSAEILREDAEEEALAALAEEATHAANEVESEVPPTSTHNGGQPDLHPSALEDMSALVLSLTIRDEVNVPPQVSIQAQAEHRSAGDLPDVVSTSDAAVSQDTEEPGLNVAQLLARLNVPAPTNDSREHVLPEIRFESFELEFRRPSFGQPFLLLAPAQNQLDAHSAEIMDTQSTQIPEDTVLPQVVNVGDVVNTESESNMMTVPDHVVHDEAYDPSAPLFGPVSNGYDNNNGASNQSYFSDPVGSNISNATSYDIMDTTDPCYTGTMTEYVYDAQARNPTSLEPCVPSSMEVNYLDNTIVNAPLYYQHIDVPHLHQAVPDEIVAHYGVLPSYHVEDNGPCEMLGIEVEMGDAMVGGDNYYGSVTAEDQARHHLETTFDVYPRTAITNVRFLECAKSLERDLEWICEGFRNLKASDGPGPRLMSFYARLEVDVELSGMQSTPGSEHDYSQSSGANDAPSIVSSSDPLTPPGLGHQECAGIPHRIPEVQPTLLDLPSDELEKICEDMNADQTPLPTPTLFPLCTKSESPPQRLLPVKSPISDSKPWRRVLYQRPPKEKKRVVSDWDILRKFKGRCPPPVFKVKLPPKRPVVQPNIVTVSAPVSRPFPVPERKPYNRLVLRDYPPAPPSRVREQTIPKLRALPLTPKRYTEPSGNVDAERAKKPSLFRRAARLIKGLLR